MSWQFSCHGTHLQCIFSQQMLRSAPQSPACSQKLMVSRRTDPGSRHWLLCTALHQLWGAYRFLTVSPSPAYVGWTSCLQSTSASAPALLLLLADMPSVPSQLFCPVLLSVKSAHHQAKADSWSLISILLHFCQALAHDHLSKLQFSYPSLEVWNTLHMVLCAVMF